jgi:hypothetical protein
LFADMRAIFTLAYPVSNPKPGAMDLFVPYEGGYQRAGLAQSWARQGVHMGAYGEEIRSRYEEATQ